MFKVLTATTGKDDTAETKRLSARLLGFEFSVVDMKCIDRDKHIIRANVVDDAIRREILTKARLLKDIPEFSKVYIHRDITYNHRQVLFERQAAVC